MNNKKAALATMMAMAMTMDTQSRPHPTKSHVDKGEKPKVMPKGCQRYEFSNPDFTCVAIKEKNAKDKWEKFKKSLLSKKAENN